MKKPRIRMIDIIYWAALVAADIFIYGILGVLLMGYEDHYDASQGAYGSWAGMTAFDKWATVALYLWHLVNVLVLIRVGYKIYRRVSTRKTPAPQKE